MDDSTWVKLDDIWTALSESIGVLLPLADGLDGYSSRSAALSGAHAAAYANTLLSAYDKLAGIAGELGKALEHARAGMGSREEERTESPGDPSR